ncbi:hypothetical protein QYE76_008396 [Lolium multiflorum]|uniref:Uncharacterized protein n=1 Tax=Lolium multiflorum TaxID=4521 RepID=A0AAD8X2L7_LOLMU|nr:hypothetical protein QYE76_008396 [Lolium multiflorum]
MDSTAQTILSNVGQLVGKEFEKLRAVGGEIEELRDELATMHALLRMQTEAEDGAVDHFIREWMRQVRELTYDAEDCVDLYIFRIRSRPRDRFLVWSKRLVATLFPRHRLAGNIKALRARAVSISDRHARYGVGREALRRSPSMALMMAASSAARGMRSANHTGQIVGLEDQANALAEKVKACGMELKVFSIVGFGGLGKTTLAMEVCRRLEVDSYLQAQVSVSQMFNTGEDLKELLKRVLQQIFKREAGNEEGNKENDPLTGIDTMDADQIGSKLKALLNDKRFLIMIDDVWTVAAWDAIYSKFPNNKCGSRIIVTTRIETVAKECSDPSVEEYYIYRMQPLNPEYSRKLFLSRAFGTMDAPPHEQLEVTMDNILKKCAGLPLAIVSIASLLASYKYPERKDMWETICKSIGSQMESNPTLEGMGQILTLSYNHLPYHLKACMLYLSLFPEDYEINKNRLLYRWVAEGLVEEKRGLTLLEVAESYFDELVGRSMIIPASSWGYAGRIEVCRVHDMMLEVMVSKSLEANFVSLVGGHYDGMFYDRVRRLSIQGIEHERRHSMERMDMQHVRSLSMFELNGKNLFDRLREFTLLRVLDLESCQGLENKHVVVICQMYLLKFLSLKGTDISVMPNKVGELEHLQVLDVRDTNLHELPETVITLEKVERMDFSHRQNWMIWWILPKGLSKMKALREVARAQIDNVDVAREFGELGQLRRIFLFVNDNLHVDNKGDPKILREVALSLSKLYSLRFLGIGRLGTCDGKLDFLDRLPSPPRLLRYLFIDGEITKLPHWVSTLSHLTFFGGVWINLRGDHIFGTLCKLPSLQNIKLWRDCIRDSTLVLRSTHRLPVLRALSLCSTYCFSPQVIQFERGCMDKLEELSVTFYEDTGRIIVGIEHLKNLKEVQLTGKRNNSFLLIAQEKLRSESNGRPKANQFKVIVRYE